MIDNEVQRVQHVLWHAMFDFHRGQSGEHTLWFWGREYRISVTRDGIVIQTIQKK